MINGSRSSWPACFEFENSVRTEFFGEYGGLRPTRSEPVPWTELLESRAAAHLPRCTGRRWHAAGRSRVAPDAARDQRPHSRAGGTLRGAALRARRPPAGADRGGPPGGGGGAGAARRIRGPIAPHAGIGGER